jgi:hypothetical protein
MRQAKPRLLLKCIAVAFWCIANAPAQTAASDSVVIRLRGTDFTGGANETYGRDKCGEQVNYVYAQSTGPHAIMQATFSVPAIPTGPMFLYLRARDDDGAGKCGIAVAVNGKTLFEGPNEFAENRWQVLRLAIPTSALKAGDNELVIRNLSPEGKLGMPPWFMVAGAVIAGKDYIWTPDIAQDFFVTLPPAVRPLPEPLAPGQSPGFKFRGMKGWTWSPKQYLSEIPVLAKYKMTFLMNCYGSMYDIEHFPWGDPNVNRWWEPLPDSKRQAYENVVRECQRAGLQFCFSMNPNLFSARPVKYDNADDLVSLWQHYSWMQGLGVKWFNISLDDITEGINAPGQAQLVNEMFARLRARDPEAQMIFCPTFYWGDGTDPDARPYLETIARDLHPEVYLFWTGDAVVGRITRKAAETYRSIAKHRLFLWDNYPVNDGTPTMHLGPVTGRDPDLCEVIDGYMSNSMCPQNEANRIPLLTCADYAYNPRAYDPARSIGQAILHLGTDDAQRGVFTDLVEAYSGMLLYGGGTNFNAVHAQFTRLTSAPHSRYIADIYLQHLEQLLARMNSALPNQFGPEKATLAGDIAWMKSAISDKYGESEPR